MAHIGSDTDLGGRGDVTGVKAFSLVAFFPDDGVMF